MLAVLERCFATAGAPTGDPASIARLPAKTYVHAPIPVDNLEPAPTPAVLANQLIGSLLGKAEFTKILETLYPGRPPFNVPMATCEPPGTDLLGRFSRKTLTEDTRRWATRIQDRFFVEGIFGDRERLDAAICDGLDDLHHLVLDTAYPGLGAIDGSPAGLPLGGCRFTVRQGLIVAQERNSRNRSSPTHKEFVWRFGRGLCPTQPAGGLGSPIDEHVGDWASLASLKQLAEKLFLGNELDELLGRPEFDQWFNAVASSPPRGLDNPSYHPDGALITREACREIFRETRERFTPQVMADGSELRETLRIAWLQAFDGTLMSLFRQMRETSGIGIEVPKADALHQLGFNVSMTIPLAVGPLAVVPGNDRRKRFVFTTNRGLYAYRGGFTADEYVDPQVLCHSVNSTAALAEFAQELITVVETVARAAGSVPSADASLRIAPKSKMITGAR